MPDETPPSLWIERHLPLARPGSRALDLACGSGRHVTLLLERGFRVTAVDRDIGRLEPTPGLEAVQADLENGSPWPLPGRSFDLIVVTNYLHRPLFAAIAGALVPSGVLLYETFAAGNEKYGKPSNPAFLLKNGELLDIARQHELRVMAYDTVDDRTAVRQRIAAQKP